MFLVRRSSKTKEQNTTKGPKCTYRLYHRLDDLDGNNTVSLAEASGADVTEANV